MTHYFAHEAINADSIAHGFFGREGGVSEGLYASLNCGPGSHDNPAHIKENRARVAQALGYDAGALCSLYQIHSADVVTLDSPFGDDRPKADAMVTNKPGILLGILTADCAPVLFADAAAGVIGAAHAGWKGAFTGVIENTVAAMEALGARREHIQAVIGPCIAQHSYEVGPEFVARLVEADAANARFFMGARHPGLVPGSPAIGSALLREIPVFAQEQNRDDSVGKAFFNLPAYVLARLVAAGLHGAQWIGMDTRPVDALFFSYRRTTLRAEADYGRQISAIGIK